jgi:hypothetical protein
MIKFYADDSNFDMMLGQFLFFKGMKKVADFRRPKRYCSKSKYQPHQNRKEKYRRRKQFYKNNERLLNS